MLWLSANIPEHIKYHGESLMTDQYPSSDIKTPSEDVTNGVLPVAELR